MRELRAEWELQVGRAAPQTDRHWPAPQEAASRGPRGPASSAGQTDRLRPERALALPVAV